jgi:hypothetical protein
MNDNLLNFKGFGIEGNLLSIKSWMQVILAVMVGLIAFALGQSLKQKVSQFSPIETNIESVVYTPAQATPSREVI